MLNWLHTKSFPGQVWISHFSMAGGPVFKGRHEAFRLPGSPCTKLCLSASTWKVVLSPRHSQEPLYTSRLPRQPGEICLRHSQIPTISKENLIVTLRSAALYAHLGCWRMRRAMQSWTQSPAAGRELIMRHQNLLFEEAAVWSLEKCEWVEGWSRCPVHSSGRISPRMDLLSSLPQATAQFVFQIIGI